MGDYNGAVAWRLPLLRVLLAIAVLASVVGVAPTAAHAVTGQVPDRTWVTNGRVSTIVQAGGRIYLGGHFTQVGPNTGSGVVLDASTGDRVGGPRVEGVVYAAVPDGAGGWYLGGSFGEVEGVTRRNAAHVDAAGAVSAWNPRVNGIVRALAVAPGRVFLAGDFTEVGGADQPYAAAVSQAGGLADWSPTFDGPVHALALSPDQGKLLAGGRFTTVSGSARARLAALDVTTGALDGAFAAGANGTVNALDTSPDGAVVYAAGEFTTAGGLTRNRLAALTTAEGTVTGWNPDADAPVAALAVGGDGTVFAGGLFSRAGAAARERLAALNSSTGAATAWNPSVTGCFSVSAKPCTAAVQTLTVSADGETIYAGGLFTNVGTRPRSNLAAISRGTGEVSAWDPKANGAVRAVAAAGGQVYAGGDLTSVGGTSRVGLAALDASSGALDPGFVADATGGDVNALALSSGGRRLFVAGYFTKVNGRARAKLAAVDTTTGAVDVAWAPRADAGPALGLAVAGDSVFVGGKFTGMSGSAAPYLAKVHATTGEVDAGFAPTPNSWVGAVELSPDQSRLYAGGKFSKVKGIARSRLASFNTATGAMTDWKPTVTYPITALDASSDGATVYSVGQGRRDVGNRVSSFDPNVSGAPRWESFGGDGNTQAVASAGPTVYVGGHFTRINGQPRNRIAAFDAASGGLLPWNPGANSVLGVWALERTDTSLLVGGDFTLIGGRTQQGFARLPGAP